MFSVKQEFGDVSIKIVKSFENSIRKDLKSNMATWAYRLTGELVVDRYMLYASIKFFKTNIY